MIFRVGNSLAEDRPKADQNTVESPIPRQRKPRSQSDDEEEEPKPEPGRLDATYCSDTRR